ncbi:MAG: hypothetical protein DRO40_02125 [Thermoprotei archaeon]|nr:MAG: hypothetical protein DRO40_02125 [Thermoprotei archaeon]
MSSSELLSEIKEIKERLARVESMLRFIIEKNIEEVEPLPDEIEAIESEDELVDLDEIKRKLLGSK